MYRVHPPAALLVGAALAAVMAVAACKGGERGPECSADAASIQAQIIMPSCALSGCHTANDSAGRLSLAGGAEQVEQLVGAAAPACAGKIMIVPGAPERSYFYEKMVSFTPACGVHMPVAGDLSAAQKECVRGWIAGLPAGR